MNKDAVQTLVIALLGSGGAAFVWTIVKSVLAVRQSAEGREDKAVARLAAWEADCRQQLAYERRWGAYWQRRVATLEYGLKIHGIDPPPREPEPVVKVMD